MCIRDRTAALLHRQLGISHNLTSRHQRFSLLQTEIDVEEHLLARYLRKVIRDGEVLGLLGSYIDISDGTGSILQIVDNTVVYQV